MSAVELGPFEEIDLDRVIKFLAQRNVPHEITVDEQMREQQLAQHNAGIKNPKGFQPARLAFTFIQISQSDMDRVAGELEETGLYSTSTGEHELSGEDYMCVECDHHSHQPGSCPKCKIELKDYSAYVAHRQSESAHTNKFALWFIIAVVVIVVAYLNFGRG